MHDLTSPQRVKLAVYHHVAGLFVHAKHDPAQVRAVVFKALHHALRPYAESLCRNDAGDGVRAVHRRADENVTQNAPAAFLVVCRDAVFPRKAQERGRNGIRRFVLYEAALHRHERMTALGVEAALHAAYALLKGVYTLVAVAANILGGDDLLRRDALLSDVRQRIV